VAEASHANTVALAAKLAAVPGVKRAFNGAVFHECVIMLPKPAPAVLKALETQGILGGLALADDYPALANAVVVCATETKTAADLDRYAAALAQALRAP